MIIDTHAHLYYDELLKDIDKVIERAVESEVEKIIVPAVDIKTSEKIISLADKYSMIFAAVGFHPCDISDYNVKELNLLENFISHPKVLAVGEIGLDYFWNTNNIDKQKSFFKEQIELAKSHKLPVIIHTRNSIKDAIKIISDNIDSNLSGQFHCFSGDKNDLKEILSFDNFYVSFCGNITYKKYSEINVIEQTPVEKLLSETDSPFLSPEPYRGKTNEPSRVIYTLKKIAGIKNCDYNEMIQTIYQNTLNLFFKKLNRSQ